MIKNILALLLVFCFLCSTSYTTPAGDDVREAVDIVVDNIVTIGEDIGEDIDKIGEDIDKATKSVADDVFRGLFAH